MGLSTFFAGLSSAATATKTIQSLIKNTRGTERSLLLELQKNMSLVYLFMDNETKLETVIGRLDTRVYEEAVKSDFDFRKLKKAGVSPQLIGGVKQLQPYVGWSIEQLFENIYLKIHELKSIIEIDPHNTKYRLRVRLGNLLKVMVLLVKHVKAR